MLKALSTIVASLALVGCVDASKSFDDYAKRVVDGGVNSVDRPVFTAIPDITGSFLLVARPNLEQDRFIQAATTYTMTANEDGTATLSYTLNFLRVADRLPSTQQPVITGDNVHINLDGTFEAPLEGKLPGDANPVIPGNVAAINGVIHGEIHSVDFVCGTFSGTAGSLSLQGTTFGAQRVPNFTDPLPDPIVRCPATDVDAGM
jgi:hypothetical protein